jgi:acyl-coenzyme A thioesterase PaaI-like protein
MQTTSAQPATNRLTRLVERVHALPLPRPLQQRVLSFAAGLSVPYLATSSVEFVEVRAASATLLLRNRRKVQNHMKGVHASAMFLLAEAATGTVLSANLPDGSKYATTHIQIDYKQKATGDLTAVATLSAEQRDSIRTQAKGKLAVPVTLTDERGGEPAHFTIEWSWKHGATR